MSVKEGIEVKSVKDGISNAGTKYYTSLTNDILYNTLKEIYSNTTFTDKTVIWLGPDGVQEIYNREGKKGLQKVIDGCTVNCGNKASKLIDELLKD